MLMQDAVCLCEQSMRAYAEWGRETEMKVQDSSGLARPDEQLSFLQLQVCAVRISKPLTHANGKVYCVWPGKQTGYLVCSCPSCTADMPCFCQHSSALGSERCIASGLARRDAQMARRDAP